DGGLRKRIYWGCFYFFPWLRMSLWWRSERGGAGGPFLLLSRGSCLKLGQGPAVQLTAQETLSKGTASCDSAPSWEGAWSCPSRRAGLLWPLYDLWTSTSRIPEGNF
uniref:Uncharacterized protein n=1 Tax=Laticauda laticaudata TaxID=8630 RepID=A0A8C5S8U5_LATLA